jgi:hypothetical protein
VVLLARCRDVDDDLLGLLRGGLRGLGGRWGSGSILSFVSTAARRCSTAASRSSTLFPSPARADQAKALARTASAARDARIFFTITSNAERLEYARPILTPG